VHRFHRPLLPAQSGSWNTSDRREETLAGCHELVRRAKIRYAASDQTFSAADCGWDPMSRAPCLRGAPTCQSNGTSQQVSQGERDRSCCRQVRIGTSSHLFAGLRDLLKSKLPGGRGLPSATSHRQTCRTSRRASLRHIATGEAPPPVDRP